MPSRVKNRARSFTGNRALCIGILTLALAGCAQIPPEEQKLSQPKNVADYQTSASFTAPPSAWPESRWWTQYGDLQLDTLIDEALSASPDMAIALARVRQAEASTQISGAKLLPQFGVTASVTQQQQSYNYLSPAAFTPQGWNDYGMVATDLKWEIDFWGKNRAGLIAATSELEARRAEQAQASLMISTAVATSYSELARLFAARATSEQAVKVRKKTAELFAERYQHGMENLGGVRQAQAGLADAQQLLLLVEEQIGLQRNQVAALLGAGPDRGLAITEPKLNLNRDYGLPKELSLNLIGRRPDIVAARLQAQAQESRIDQKKADFYPNVNLVGLLGFQSLGLNVLTQSGSTIGSIGPAIYLPIFTGGRLTGELRSARAQYEEAVGTYNQTLVKALQDVADAALSKKSLSPRLLKIEEAVAAATDAYRVARERYEGNLSSYLEVLTAEDTLLNNLRLLTDLQSRALTLDIALTRALGGGYQYDGTSAK